MSDGQYHRCVVVVTTKLYDALDNSAQVRIAAKKGKYSVGGMYANKFPIKLIIKSMSDRLMCDLINFP